ncbi:ribonuclease HI [Marinilabilia salmonicolor]|jgi:ribonuclease HI|uniref:ribonuclease H1 domain-containing protein n=1 Tax=Marinilabilia salmonicolor TaxID=989 RepID=UPI000D07D650|nr:ribonuclease H family protein [Marinilabilia salmonicolor]PRY99737.1 ribonuclease HI [Marinilabilia salmonicolor]
MPQKKFYVIWVGHQTGIVDNWAECQRRIKGYPSARYKSFKTLADAQKAFETPWSEIISTGNKGQTKKTIKENIDPGHQPILRSLAVDAACSGNPGPMEYQGVFTDSGKQWFHAKFPIGTNNIGEFLAIVHGLAELKRQKKDLPIYTDSTIALGWIKKKKCVTKLERSKQTEQLFKTIERAEKWLSTNNWTTKILKWDTKAWGEIPADFGRK